MLANQAELGINLASLKRHDPYISEIIDCSTHVALYRYVINDQVWEKTEVEGALFVYRRMAPPFYGFTILNRLKMDNLTEPLTKDLEFQTQNPFLLYKNAKNKIYGIWFFDDGQSSRIGSMLTRLCNETSRNGDTLSSLNMPHSIQSKNVSPPIANHNFNSIPNMGQQHHVPPPNHYQDKSKQTNNTGVDILKLLSQAKDKFEKTQGNPDSNKHNSMNGNIHQQNFVESMQKPQSRKVDIASLFNKSKPETVKHEMPATFPKHEPPQHLKLSMPTSASSSMLGAPFQQLNKASGQAIAENKIESPLPIDMNKLISPEDLQRSSSTPKKSPEPTTQRNSPPLCLTENELKSCLIKLIETDSDFVSKIHQAYMSHFK